MDAIAVEFFVGSVIDVETTAVLPPGESDGIGVSAGADDELCAGAPGVALEIDVVGAIGSAEDEALSVGWSAAFTEAGVASGGGGLEGLEVDVVAGGAEVFSVARHDFDCVLFVF